MLSKYLELGGDPVRILKHLNSIKSEKPYGFGKNRIDSVAHAFSVALRKHLIKTEKLKPIENGLNSSEKEDKKKVIPMPEFKVDEVLHCPKCFSSNVGMISGCSSPMCFDCGDTKCS